MLGSIENESDRDGSVTGRGSLTQKDPGAPATNQQWTAISGQLSPADFLRV